MERYIMNVTDITYTAEFIPPNALKLWSLEIA